MPNPDTRALAGDEDTIRPTMYAVLGEGPDSMGRHHIVLYWAGFHPGSGPSVRGQVFHTALDSLQERIEAMGNRLVVVATITDASSKAEADRRANRG